MADEKPLFQKQIGNVKVAVWPNRRNGRTWYAIKFVRHYRQNDESKETSTFNVEDLPVLMKVADVVFDWIWDQQVAEQSPEKPKKDDHI